MDWDDVLADLAATGAQRSRGLEKLHDFIQRGRLTPEQVSGLVRRTGPLLLSATHGSGDGNGGGAEAEAADSPRRRALMALQAWELVARTSRDAARPHALALAPVMAELLGAARQDARQLACNCLVELALAHGPPSRAPVLEALAHCWRHRAWRVRHGALQLLAESLALTGDAALLGARAPEDGREAERAARGAAAALAAAEQGRPTSIFETPAFFAGGQPSPSSAAGSSTALEQVFRMLEDPEPAVRDAALECLEEAAPAIGAPSLLAVARARRPPLRAAVLREVYARLAATEAAAAAAAATARTATAAPPTSPTPALPSPPPPGTGLSPGGGAGFGADAAGSAAAALRVTNGGPVAPAVAVTVPIAAAAASARPSRPAHHLPAAPTAAAAAAAAAKRRPGGFAAPPTATAAAAAASAQPEDAGELAPADPVRVSSERELHGELEAAALVLADLEADWSKRVACLARLEGLMRGGALELVGRPAFADAVRALLQFPLAAQVADRRSAVVRQACHLVGEMAERLGPSFEAGGVAAHLLAAMARLSMVTVAVVAESGERGARRVVAAVRCPRCLLALCDLVLTDRNPKLRAGAAALLQRALETWPPASYAPRCAPQAEAAIAKALGDALAGARACGRGAFLAYALANPEAGAGLLRRLPEGLQGKLQAELAAAGAAAALAGGGARAGGGAAAPSPPSSSPASSRSPHAAAGRLQPPPARAAAVGSGFVAAVAGSKKGGGSSGWAGPPPPAGPAAAAVAAAGPGGPAGGGLAAFLAQRRAAAAGQAPREPVVEIAVAASRAANQNGGGGGGEDYARRDHRADAHEGGGGGGARPAPDDGAEKEATAASAAAAAAAAACAASAAAAAAAAAAGQQAALAAAAAAEVRRRRQSVAIGAAPQRVVVVRSAAGAAAGAGGGSAPSTPDRLGPPLRETAAPAPAFPAYGQQQQQQAARWAAGEAMAGASRVVAAPAGGNGGFAASAVRVAAPAPAFQQPQPHYAQAHPAGHHTQQHSYQHYQIQQQHAQQQQQQEQHQHQHQHQSAHSQARHTAAAVAKGVAAVMSLPWPGVAAHGSAGGGASGPSKRGLGGGMGVVVSLGPGGGAAAAGGSGAGGAGGGGGTWSDRVAALNGLAEALNRHGAAADAAAEEARGMDDEGDHQRHGHHSVYRRHYHDEGQQQLQQQEEEPAEQRAERRAAAARAAVEDAAAPDVERALPWLLAGVEDAHSKVSLAALSVVEAALAASPRSLEPSLDRALPPLFGRLVAPREGARAAAEACLKLAALSCAPDALLAGLARTLEQARGAPGRVAALEFTVLFMGPGSVCGCPQNAAGLRGWLARVAPLLRDKHPDVRRMAARAVAVAEACDAPLAAAAAAGDSEDAAALRQAVGAARRERLLREQREDEEEEAAQEHEHEEQQQQQQLLQQQQQQQRDEEEDEREAAMAAMEAEAEAVEAEALAAAREVDEQAIVVGVAGETYTDQNIGWQEQQQQQQQQQEQEQEEEGTPRAQSEDGGDDREAAAAAAAASPPRPPPAVAELAPLPAAVLEERSVAASVSARQSGWEQQQQQHQEQEQQRPSPPLQQQQQRPDAAFPEEPRELQPRPDSPSTPRDMSAAAAAAILAATPPPAARRALVMPGGGAAAGPPAAADAAGGAAVVAADCSPAPDLGTRRLPELAERLQACASSAPTEVLAEIIGTCLPLVQQQQQQEQQQSGAETEEVAASSAHDAAWAGAFAPVLRATLAAARLCPDETGREMAFVVVRQLALHQPARLVAPLLLAPPGPDGANDERAAASASLLPALLRGVGDPSAEVRAAAGLALERVLDAVPAPRALELLGPALRQQQQQRQPAAAQDGDDDGDGGRQDPHRALCAAARCAQRAFGRWPPGDGDALVAHARACGALQGLLAAFSHSQRPDARKAGVFALSALWRAAGAAALEPALATLTTPQMRLLAVYCERLGAGGGGGAMS